MDEIEWRTIQFFISEDGVCEVQVDADDPTNLKCTCPVFVKTARCKHTKFIREKTKSFGGHYTIRVPFGVSEDEAVDAMQDPKMFREFLLRHGRPEEV
jgi:hypothetical protein